MELNTEKPSGWKYLHIVAYLTMAKETIRDLYSLQSIYRSSNESRGSILFLPVLFRILMKRSNLFFVLRDDDLCYEMFNAKGFELSTFHLSIYIEEATICR